MTGLLTLLIGFVWGVLVTEALVVAYLARVLGGLA